MTDDTAEQVRTRLRQVTYPGFARDIVSMGFVKDIRVDQGGVTIEFSPNTRNEEKVLQMEEDIRRELSELGGTGDVRISRTVPFETAREEDNQCPPAASATRPPGECGSANSVPENPALPRANLAPGAGYGAGGPAPFGGPDTDILNAASEHYTGSIPVIQWEIDPHDSALESGEANTTHDDWEFHIWWQIHPARLVYASIQALREDWADHGGAARPHPMGRSEAVNLVYDIERKAIVAIYGTVRDFRPFVEAFIEGFAP